MPSAGLEVKLALTFSEDADLVIKMKSSIKCYDCREYTGLQPQARSINEDDQSSGSSDNSVDSLLSEEEEVDEEIEINL